MRQGGRGEKRKRTYRFCRTYGKRSEILETCAIRCPLGLWGILRDESDKKKLRTRKVKGGNGIVCV